ncbi:NUDIX domain-containing protein [Magnetovibrio sp. PR-2]|uniref:NUDIX domain-containing protein n=1 Tax=Magnetovibrio sp. PR-2 TaxID=3120356 RepID=UPI002FCDEC17
MSSNDEPEFNGDDVEVIEKIRDHDGYFKIDRYILKHRKHEGGWTEPISREIFERGHATCVLMFDPDLDKLVFIEQFRPGAYAALASPWFECDSHSPWLLECVAGIIDEGETPEGVAKREALEEANCEILDLQPITHYLASPGGTTESVFLFCARVDASNAGGVYGLEHEGEDIRVVVCDAEKALSWLDTGRFKDASAHIAMQWFALNHEKLKTRWQA